MAILSIFWMIVVVRKKIMNRIVIDRNRLSSYLDDAVSIHDKRIVFKKNGDYTLEYVNSDKIDLEIFVEDDVIIKLFIFSEDNSLTTSIHYRLGKRSNLLLFQFYCNKSVIENVIVDLDGEYSKFSSGFSSISTGDERYHIIVNHHHHHVSSDISNKCIGFDGSKLFFQIDSVLDKGNVECVMDQNTRILTMGDVDATVVPNMFIDEDSVSARHGSVIGSFDEEEIFYFMSRGICRLEAIQLLMKGFIFSNLVVDMEKRRRILACIQKMER